MNVFARFDAIPSMTLQDIKEICTYKSHLELQREITPIVLAPCPYFFISSICLVHMNVFAKFDEIPYITRTVGRKDGQRETQFAGGIIKQKQKIWLLLDLREFFLCSSFVFEVEFAHHIKFISLLSEK